MSERVTGLLYLGDRSWRISLSLALMVQSVEGICHQQSCRWSRGLSGAFDLTKQENKTSFQLGAGGYLPRVTLEFDSLHLLSSLHTIVVKPLSLIPVGLCSAVRIIKVFPAGRGNKIMGFSMRGYGGGWGTEDTSSVPCKAYIFSTLIFKSLEAHSKVTRGRLNGFVGQARSAKSWVSVKFGWVSYKGVMRQVS